MSEGIDVHGEDVGAICDVLMKREGRERIATLGVVIAGLLDEKREVKENMLLCLSDAIDQAWRHVDAARD